MNLLTKRIWTLALYIAAVIAETLIIVAAVIAPLTALNAIPPAQLNRAIITILVMIIGRDFLNAKALKPWQRGAHEHPELEGAGQ